MSPDVRPRRASRRRADRSAAATPGGAGRPLASTGIDPDSLPEPEPRDEPASDATTADGAAHTTVDDARPSGASSSDERIARFLHDDLDEGRLDADLQFRARRLRRLGLLGLVLVAGGVAAWFAFADDDEPAVREQTGLNFAVVEDDPAVPTGVVSPVEIDARLVTRLATPVVVREGDEARTDRVEIDPPDQILPIEPGTVVAGLARFGSTGRLLLVGPPGWMGDACVTAQVTSTALRPLSSVYFAPDPESCPSEPVGTEAPVVCEGTTTAVIEIDVPQGEVALAEGGSAFADAVRIQLLGSASFYETVSVRGTIDVADDLTIDVPEFAGPAGADAAVLLGGAGARAECTFA
ncbi:MAG: hypothetical protein HKN26_09020 [Acidimicrobiales bacterium]|nr:hypothetical protein [Acidimicrobiales bacterium]